MIILQIAAIVFLAVVPLSQSKVYKKCELARELSENHGISSDDLAIFVCIAENQSNFNTEAIGQGIYYGIFQMSNEFWCNTYDSYDNKACEVDCDKLIDDDLSDDLQCMRTIIDEHERISGNGFNAWPSGTSCQSIKHSYLAECSIESNQIIGSQENSIVQQRKKSGSNEKGGGRVYERCELARELRYQHNIPMNEIASWVCIAKHESNFNTSAVGRLNWDGSEDHGLFQISDIYWCGNDGQGKACNAECHEFRDNDISNDISCIKRIYEEHTRLSGDGFNAWTVYKPKCKGKSKDFIKGCFDKSSNEVLPFLPSPGIQQHPNKIKITYGKINHRVSEKVTEKGKIYDRCELAQELRYKHKIAMEQVSTWVCIAKQESNYDTSAIGLLNADGSEDHGIFQISDLFWCSIEGQGKGCNMACSELEDSDLTNDVECMLKIHEEHTFLSGDGFNAWTTYPRCKDQSEEYIRGCFNDNENFIQNVRPGIYQPVTLNPIQKIPLTTITQSSTIIEPKTTTERFYFDTAPQETTTYAQKSTLKVITEKPFKSFFNSLQKPSNDVKQQKQQSKIIANNKSPTSSPVFKSSGSNVGTISKKTNNEINDEQKIIQALTTTKKPSTSSTLRISYTTTTTTTPRYLKSSTMINKESTTRKSSTVKSTSLKTQSKPSTSFDIFAFYLSDYTSKRPSINYKPIEFDSKKSTVIINNKSKKSLQPKVFRQVELKKSSTTPPRSSNFNHLLSNYYDERKISQSHIGKIVGNITPHSIEYLLRITTPRTFYG